MLTASCINRAYSNGGHIMMTYATSSPAATTGGGQGNNNIPVSVQQSRVQQCPVQRCSVPAVLPSPVLVLASVISSYRHNHRHNHNHNHNYNFLNLLTARSLIPYRFATMATFADHDRGTVQPVCQNCATSTTPLWRRDEIGSVLCNACGLFLKLHGSPRPISLKTDVIKSRNRVKTASQVQKKKVSIDSCDGGIVLTWSSRCSRAMLSPCRGRRLALHRQVC